MDWNKQNHTGVFFLSVGQLLPNKADINHQFSEIIRFSEFRKTLKKAENLGVKICDTFQVDLSIIF